MFIYVVIGAFSSILLGSILTWYYQYFKHISYYSKYNGPSPIPIVGNVYRIFSSVDVLPVLMDYCRKYGSVIKMWFAFWPRILISDCNAAELLLGSNILIEKSYDYGFLQPWLGTGLLTSSGQKWRRQRKLLTPVFHFKILEQYIPIFDSQCKVLIYRLKKHLDRKPFDVYPYINLCTLDIICETTMGVQIQAQKGKASKYIDAVTEMNDVFIRRIFSVLKISDFLFRFSRDYQKQKHAIEILHRQTNYVIRSRQKELATHPDANKNTEAAFGSKKRMAFLDLLLQCKVDGKPLPLENVREEVDTFMFEGHDTTTSAICFILFCLSQHLDMQDKVAEELQNIFGEYNNEPPSYEELQQMKYLEMFIKESMRLYPPVPLIGRSFDKGAEFDGTTYTKGSAATVLIFGIHRQEESFPDAERFDPERFSLENSFNRSPFAYIPFSAGSRNCIGQRFAMLELKAVISKILRTFKVLPAPGFKPVLAPDAVLRSNNGIFLVLEMRTTSKI